MSARVEWDNYQRTVLRIDYGKEWTPQSSQEASAKARELYKDVTHDLPIDVVLTLDNDCVVAPEAAARLRKCAHERTRTRNLVLVCENHYIENLFKIVTTVDPVAANVYIHAHTLDEAREIIASKGSAASRACPH
ncbi:MAG: hypothetical protein SF123_22580 [Chloroflexota bacterium]|nr:hypothetical protein [Chloroflexota bacterium]